MVAIFLSYIL